MMKPVIWLGDSLKRVRAFPDAARQQAGFQLERVQHGLNPRDWKPMNVVGPGVREIRIHAGGEFRVLYLAELPHAVHVLHAFTKKQQRTPLPDIAAAQRRLREISEEES